MAAVVLQGRFEAGDSLHLESQHQTAGGQLGLAGVDVEPVLHETELQDVPGQGEDRHGDPADAAVPPHVSVGERVTQVEPDNLQHLPLHLHQLLSVVGVVTDVQEVVHKGRNPLVHLAGNQTGGGAHQLQLLLPHLLLGEVEVGHLDGGVESLVVQLEALLDLDQPVHQDGPHGLSDLLLQSDVVAHHELCLPVLVVLEGLHHVV